MPAAPVSSAAPVLDRLAVAVGGSARQSPSRVGLLAVFSKLSDLRKPCGRRHSGTVRPDDTKSGPRTVPTFGEISSSRNGLAFRQRRHGEPAVQGRRGELAGVVRVAYPSVRSCAVI